jgi:hypothetical protein
MRRLWILLIALLIIRLPYHLQEEIINVDEATIAAIAAVMADGGMVYRDAASNRGPWTYGVYWLCAEAFGEFALMPVHIVSWFWLIAVVGLLGLIVRRLVSPSAGLIAACFYVGISTFGLIPTDGVAFNTEHMMVLPQLLGVLLLVGTREPGWARYVLAGALAACAALFKQPGLIDLALYALLPLALYERRLDRAGIVAVIRAGGFSAIGAALVLGLCHYYFFSHDAHDDFVFFFYEYGLRYYTAPVTLLVWLKGLGVQSLWRLLEAPVVFVVLALFVADIVKRVRKRVSLDPLDLSRVEKFAVLWLAVECAGISVGGRFYGHYFLQTLPPLSLIAALTIPKAIELVKSIDRNHSGSGVASGPMPPVRAVAALLLAVLLLAPVAVRGRHWNKYLGNDLRNALGMSERHEESFETAGAHIRGQTDPDDRILVWGFWPEIYQVSHRKPVTKYVIPVYLTGLAPWINTDSDSRDLIVPGTWEQFVREMNEQQPAYIVDSYREPRDQNRPISLYPMLEEMVWNNYHPARSIGGFDLYERRESPWHDVTYDPDRIAREMSELRRGD